MSFSLCSRLRRSVRRDGWLKIGALLFLGAALPLFAAAANVRMPESRITMLLP